jgi:hypothetical protein
MRPAYPVTLTVSMYEPFGWWSAGSPGAGGADYAEGQDISFGDVRGRITTIESTSTVLDAGDGQSLRVPNHLLMETVVTIQSTGEKMPKAPNPPSCRDPRWPVREA